MRAAFPASAAHRPGGAPIARRENSAAAARELAGSAGGQLAREGPPYTASAARRKRSADACRDSAAAPASLAYSAPA